MSETDVILGRMKVVLERLIKEVSKGKYPAPLLADFKHSVDELRIAIWSVMEAEDQRRKELEGFPMGLDRKLVEFRILRLEEMLNQLRSDLSAGVTDPSLLDLNPLVTAIQSTIRNIGFLTADNP
jgi:hypothetical protein